jgi:methionyl-tRNA formyltransferase
MRIIFTGSGEFGLPTLKALLAADHRIVQVFTQPDRAAGRGRKITPTPVAQFAEKNSLPCRRTENLGGEDLPEADLMLVIAFGQKIPPAAVDSPRLGSINLHASRLPQFRGAAPVNWAILSGQSVTGNSIIRLATKMDAGAILGQSSVVIGPLETAGELHDRLAQDGVELTLRTIDNLQAGRAVAVEQDESKATLAPKLTRELSRIDWGDSAERISAKIRGLYPWPGCRVGLTDAAGGELGRFTLVRARAAAGEGPRWKPGEIMGNGVISVGDGSEGVELLEIQPEGKRAMALPAYRRGNPWMPGMRLSSV